MTGFSGDYLGKDAPCAGCLSKYALIMIAGLAIEIMLLWVDSGHEKVLFHRYSSVALFLSCHWRLYLGHVLHMCVFVAEASHLCKHNLE